MMSSIEELDKQIEALKIKRTKQLQKTHTTCKHPLDQVIEGKYEDLGWLGVHRPIRVCKACGYAEEGWGSGYWKLPNNYSIPQLDRDEAWKYVKKFHSQKDMYKLKYPERFDADGNEL